MIDEPLEFGGLIELEVLEINFDSRDCQKFQRLSAVSKVEKSKSKSAQTEKQKQS